eukprot:jgi/Ulvmu1/3389/UM016_0005.1
MIASGPAPTVFFMPVSAILPVRQNKPPSSSGNPFCTPPQRPHHPAEEGDVRLVDQSTVANWQLGRLEVFFEGSWSQICAKEFDGPDANVACRQLGFGAGTVGPNRANGAQPPPSATIVFPEVAVTTLGCNGTEANLLECGPAPGRLSSFETRDCFDSVQPGLFIACVAEAETGEEGALRLTDGGNGDSGTPGIGILEIFHAGAWGTVCEAEELAPADYYTQDFGSPLTEVHLTDNSSYPGKGSAVYMCT